MEIRKVKSCEYDLLKSFLAQHWKKDHALVKSKGLLDYQHLQGEYYNYYALFDNQQIVGLAGFIPLSKFDAALNDKDAWGAIWKITDGYDGYGLDILEEMLDKEATHSFGAIGISAIAKQFYTLCKWKISYLSHYYIANSKLDAFSIGKNLVTHKEQNGNDDWNVKVINDITNIQCPEAYYSPYKSKNFFIEKYSKHPIYKYIYWGIYHKEELVSLWVVRRIIVNNSSIYRIVDVLGILDGIPCMRREIEAILRTESCEYVDILNHGINEGVFNTIGFDKLDIDKGDTILPNYFEPFVPDNVKIELAYKAKGEYVVFKGDADQDRPNML